MKPLISLLVLITTSLLSLEATSYRTFTDSQNRSIVAIVESVDGNIVSLKLKHNNKTYKLPIEKLSESDQQYIRKIEKSVFTLTADMIDVQASSVKVDQYKEKTEGRSSKTKVMQYKITLKNQSAQTLKDLRIDYQIFKFKAKIEGTKIGSGNVIRIPGNAQSGLTDAKSSTSILTKTVEIKETKLDKGWIYKNGGKGKSKDKLEGIWIRIYHKDKLLKEWSQPQHILNNNEW